jgi:hypothetical protein
MICLIIAGIRQHRDSTVALAALACDPQNHLVDLFELARRFRRLADNLQVNPLRSIQA